MRLPNILTRAFFFLMLGACVSQTQAQPTAPQKPTTIAGWADRLTRFGKAIPQEKVYVHMDNTCYFLGDTIWYAAYTRRTDKDLPSGISRVLYAELYNQDGYLVERQLVEMKGGRGNGCFALPDTLYSGYYELRAYTRWQLNWGMTQHPHTKYAEEWFFSRAMAREYYRDYEKLYSRVFPVYDRPKQPGEDYHDMTTRPLRRNYEVDQEGKLLEISLYPEGGRLVGGAECRVAFEATDDLGAWMEGTMQLRDKDGQTICEAAAVSRGRGLLTFTPLPGEKYEALFTATDGRTARATVNRVPADGVSLSVQRQADGYYIKVQAQGEAAAKSLGMTIMHEGVVEQFKPVEQSPSSNSHYPRSLLVSIRPPSSIPTVVCGQTASSSSPPRTSPGPPSPSLASSNSTPPSSRHRWRSLARRRLRREGPPSPSPCAMLPPRTTSTIAVIS